MSDPNRSFLDLLAVADVHPRLLEGDRLAARLSHLSDQWAADCRHLLTAHRAEIVAELRSRESAFPARGGTEKAFRAFRDALGAAT